jgi:hypothetical protein
MPKLGLTRSAVNNRLYVNTGVIYKDDGTVKVLNMGVKKTYSSTRKLMK